MQAPAAEAGSPFLTDPPPAHTYADDEGRGGSTRIEFRSLDSACNPYLAFALILAAGLKGIEKSYELPPAAEDNVWTLTSAERRALGIEPLPGSLNDAIEVMERSELVAETLGEHVFDFFLRNKRTEWCEYRRHVTEFELGRYLRSCDPRALMAQPGARGSVRPAVFAQRRGT
jgi:glutamine synthetase